MPRCSPMQTNKLVSVSSSSALPCSQSTLASAWPYTCLAARGEGGGEVGSYGQGKGGQAYERGWLDTAGAGGGSGRTQAAHSWRARPRRSSPRATGPIARVAHRRCLPGCSHRRRRAKNRNRRASVPGPWWPWWPYSGGTESPGRETGSPQTGFEAALASTSAQRGGGGNERSSSVPGPRFICVHGRGICTSTSTEVPQARSKGQTWHTSGPRAEPRAGALESGAGAVKQPPGAGRILAGPARPPGCLPPAAGRHVGARAACGPEAQQARWTNIMVRDDLSVACTKRACIASQQPPIELFRPTIHGLPSSREGSEERGAMTTRAVCTLL